MNFDELMMHRCLTLASRGAGMVGSNPMVGAVLTADGVVIGEGYHQLFGGKHAEINAIESVRQDQKHLISESTLYVNLEPCNHFGKTPPCTDAIIKAGIKRVVIGTRDPNPAVAGGGSTKLNSNGIETITGLLEHECRDLNKFFFTSSVKGRPYVTLKWAQSSDGFVAHEDHSPKHFTNHAADILVHKWRTEYSSILVGGGTIVSDDPLLTARHWPGTNPMRVVLNTGKHFDEAQNIMNEDAPTIIFNYKKEEINNHIRFVRLDKSRQAVVQIVEQLFQLNIHSILVEGGPKTIGLFVEAGIWDEAKIFISNDVMEKGISAPAFPGSIIQTESINGQLLITTSPV